MTSTKGRAVTKDASTNVFIREVTAHYRRGKRVLQRIQGPECVRNFALKVVSDNSREHFIAIYLDGGHKVVSYSTLFVGTANQCLVHPRELFQHAVLTGATAVIVAHNHPSGTLEPSEEDKRLTKSLVQAGALLRIPILDHIIFSDEGFFSFQQAAML